MPGPAAETEQSSQERFPPGLGHAFGFATFNALSFPIVIGSPMILYAKSLGATATVLGILAGMMPLLVLFQIPAARHIPRFGYKRFVYSGWGIRTVAILGLALVPLLGIWLEPSAQIALLLMTLFLYNLARGISSSAWLPWITSIVPESLRGRYLACDAACANLGNFVVVLGAAFWLGRHPLPWQFSVLFVFSAITGGCSLLFLKRIPEAEAGEEIRASATPVPWKAMIAHPPFRQIVQFGMFWSITSGGIATFTVAWLKTQTPMPESSILGVTSVTFLGGLFSLLMMNRRLDRFGSKPTLALALILWLGIVGIWTALATERILPSFTVLLPLHFVMGLASSLVGISVMRQVMGSIPKMGRSHFFAIYSVATSVTLGLTPVGWGIFLDVLRESEWALRNLGINHYGAYFLVVEILLLGNLLHGLLLKEAEGVPMNRLLRQILIDSPQRLWFRFWVRR